MSKWPKNVSISVLRSLICLALLLGLSSCARQVPPRAFPVKAEPIIVVDPGHGGKDEGCADTIENVEEKELTLKVAAALECYLFQRGYRVYMTRSQDAFVSLDERVAFANDVKPELFVSLHFNAAESRQAKGIEVFYYDDKFDPPRGEASQQLATAVLEQVIHATGRRSRGVKTADFRVIKKTAMPAILVEGGFLTNPEERALCQEEDYINALAYGIARGIEEFIRSSPARVERATCCLGGNRSIH